MSELDRDPLLKDLAPFFIIMLLIVLVVVFFIANSDEQMERMNQWDYEESWVNTASCPELKAYIVFDLENNPENSHFFTTQAKELYKWKCEK